MYGGNDYALVARPGQDTAAMLRQATERLPENVFGKGESGAAAPAPISELAERR
jgi:hypothetical protein